jgi:hypothetical protein
MQLRTGLLILLFLGSWILPVIYAGLFDRQAPWLPNWLGRWSNVSRLFSYESEAWAVYGVRVRCEGEPPHYVDEKEFFHFRPFGYRSRFQRALDISTQADRETLAEFLRRKIEESRPGCRVRSIEFIEYPYSVGKASNSGRYHPPAISEVSDLRVISVHEFQSEP